jgi:glutathione synthase/RimK-type ligase-like ATP-grasp enzyme
MKKCVILTMDKFDDFEIYDNLLDKPMADCGWQTSHISWRERNVDWKNYDAVIIRSTWDYQDDADLFMQVLNDIENSGTVLLNSLAIAQWNINKNYLKEVEQKGASIIPTIWLEEFNYLLLESYFEHFKTNQLVIKPTISANSDNTFWLKRETFQAHKDLLESSLIHRQLMVQPFIPAIVEEGEYSLFYFAGNFSHCILKTPKSGDFRVQEEHGGILKSIDPSKELMKAAHTALKTVPEKVLYARIDLVNYKDEYQVMEIELIEPSLYFKLDDQAAVNFSHAFKAWMDAV